jgi:hypothetical protein
MIMLNATNIMLINDANDPKHCYITYQIGGCDFTMLQHDENKFPLISKSRRKLLKKISKNVR